MDIYQYQKQKPENPSNQEKYYQFNNNKNNFQIQNFFRADNNANKQKPREYIMNNKKEIHFTSGVKDNELQTSGPKILTEYFPPVFTMKNNNENMISRKTGSHEKNIYAQQNMINNLDLNNSGLEENDYFANTSKARGGYNNINQFYNDKQKQISQKSSFNYKSNNNSNNENNLNICVGGNEYNSRVNTGYCGSETDLNSGRGGSSQEKDNYTKQNHFKTDGSDYDNSKTTPKAVTASSNFKSNNTTKTFNNNYYYSNLKSNNKIPNSKEINTLKNVLSNKNMRHIANIPSNSSHEMRRKGSDSDYCPASVNQLYMGLKNYNNLNEPKIIHSPSSCNNNIQSENEMISNNLYAQREYHSNYTSSQGNSNPQSYDKKSTKTHTNFVSNISKEEKNLLNSYMPVNRNSEKNPQEINLISNNSNYRGLKNYENVMFEMHKPSSHSKISLYNMYNNNGEKNIFEMMAPNKKKPNNLNLGISYKLNNGYKYYFNLPNEEIYILKEILFSKAKGTMNSVKNWNKKYEKNPLYLKIYGHEVNWPEGHLTYIMEYPTGGENLTDLINSVGFYDQNLLFFITTKIFDCITKLKDDKEYFNIPFCLCDAYINISEHIKLIPPPIRNISFSYNKKNDKQNNDIHEYCKCKQNLIKLKEIYTLNPNNTSFFCLGFIILQIITQNMLFDLRSFKFLLSSYKKNKPVNNNIRRSNAYSNNLTERNGCCLVHLLLNIEENEKLNRGDFLLLAHFLDLYPGCLISFLHECTSFNGIVPSSSNEFLNLYDTSKNLNITIKEIFEIMVLPSNSYITLDEFLRKFENLYKNIQLNSNEFSRILYSKKIINILSRTFNIGKEKLMNYIKQRTVTDNALKNNVNNNEDMINNKNYDYNYKNDNYYEDNDRENDIQMGKDNCEPKENFYSLLIGYNQDDKGKYNNLFK